jgi:hypothetical protein
MKENPEVLVKALLIHNHVIRQAKYDCFGYTIEQEGGEGKMGAVVLCWQFLVIGAPMAVLWRRMPS